MDKIRWGIIGTGNIAHQFARGLRAVNDAELIAVGSRSQAGADKFGDEFNVPHRHASYEALANDADVDAVYISTPHPMHHDNTLLCLDAGKAVLCEKPFAINVKLAREMVDKARAKNIFLMEAMWTRHLPAVKQAKQWAAEGAIGAVQRIQADFCFRTKFDAKHRLFAPELGGGALLDVGIYPLSLAAYFLGMPESVKSAVILGETGVDEQNAIVLRYASGALAQLSSATRVQMPIEALIVGETGTIRLHAPFFKCERVTLSQNEKVPDVRDIPHPGNGYEYEAMEVGACLRAGKTESPIMPLDETLAIMELMDNIRADWGLKYPGE